MGSGLQVGMGMKWSVTEGGGEHLMSQHVPGGQLHAWRRRHSANRCAPGDTS